MKSISHASRLELVIFMLKQYDACAPLMIEIIYIVENITF